MELSIVIPTKNREADLIPCVWSVATSVSNHYKGSHVGKAEIIVIDDNSDKPLESLISKIPQGINFHRLTEDTGPAEARNIGFRISSGDIVAYIDSDCIADTSWVSSIIHSMNNTNCPAVQGVPWLYQDMTSWLAQQNSLLERYFWDTKIIDNGKYCDTLDSKNLALHKKAIDNITGIDGFFPKTVKIAAAEDRIAGRKLAATNQILWNPDMKVYHKNPESFSAMIEQKYRHGKGGYAYFGSNFPLYEKFKKHFIKPIQFGVNPLFVASAHGAFWYGYFSERLKDLQK